ncbi:MAG: hypothetical protein ACE5FO_01260 [Parvularculaceae bacterium]
MTTGSAFTLATARLRGVRGFTGRGVVQYLVWLDGARRLTIRLKGLAGLTADFYLNGAFVRRLPVSNGAARMICSSRGGGEAPPAIEAGDVVEIRQNGDPVLEGAASAYTRLRTMRRSLRRLWLLWKISWRARPRILRIFGRPH